MNTQFLLSFLLAHFIGDFVFQTNKIAQMKAESIKGIFYHSIIVLIFQVALLSIFGIKGMVAGFISSIIHFAIDYGKLAVEKHVKRLSFIYFAFDQVLHIAVMVILDYILKPDMVLNDHMVLYIKYLIFFIAFTYVPTIMSKMLLRDLFFNIRKAQFFLGNERIIDGAFSLLIFISIVNFNLLDIILSFILIFIIYLILQKKLYSYTFNIIVFKFSFYLIIGCIGSFIYTNLL
ncbi:DUF3307 domain-containing protein [Anaerovorax odorimutans]|uniref:DUF3307 domain-containing protein n=1 Tax=Anaerovorax odorimutans TaxID=109327 RepID=UPI00040A36B0|nr:DUF3307 domain-containing protein [Anaerovorax odorimutans]